MNFRRTLVQTGCLAAGAGVMFSAATVRADVNPDLQKQRMEVLAAGQKGAAGLPVLVAAMKNPNALVRRAAVRSMGDIGAPAADALSNALKSDDDALVRRTALRALVQLKDKDAASVLEPALKDSSELVRAAAVQSLADMHPYTEQITALLKQAQQDPSNDVSKVASEALWPFHKNGVSVREKPEFKDHQLTVVQTIPMPESDWRFQTDLGQTGQEHDWFGATFNDGSWQKIKIGEAWETQINNAYDGVAWYRKTFTLPAKPAQDGTDIIFEGVDESAWVWINGQYIGQHDIGPDGWNKRFAMDVSDALKWGGENQITVRVLDRKMAGGIWKPVYLEVLKQ